MTKRKAESRKPVKKTAAKSEGSRAKGRTKKRTTKATKGARKTKRGRGKSRSYEQGVAAPSRCAKCGSTHRGKYTQKREIAQGGLSPVDGKPFNVIVLRWTNCRECGQHRVDRTYENRRRSR